MPRPNNVTTDMTPQILDHCIRIGLDTHTDREDYLTYNYLLIDDDEIVGYNNINDVIDIPYITSEEFIKTYINLPIFTRKPR